MMRRVALVGSQPGNRCCDRIRPREAGGRVVVNHRAGAREAEADVGFACKALLLREAAK